MKISNNCKRILACGIAITLAAGASHVAAPNQKTSSIVPHNMSYSSTVTANVTKELTVHQGVNIYINDKLFIPKDEKGNEVITFVYNGTTYLPIRAISEALGMKISWEDGVVKLDTSNKQDPKNDTDPRPDAQQYQNQINVICNVPVYIDGELFVPKDEKGNVVDIYGYNGTTYLPVRAIANKLGIDIRWDGNRNTVFIGKRMTNTQTYPNLSKELSDKIDLYLNKAKNLVPLLQKIAPNQLAVGDLYIDSSYKLFEIEEMCENSQDQEMLNYYEQYKILVEEIGQLNIQCNKISGASTVQGYIDQIVSIPKDITESQLDNRYNIEALQIKFEVIDTSISNYDSFMEKSTTDKLQPYWDQVNSLYNAIKKIYNGKQLSLN